MSASSGARPNGALFKRPTRLRRSALDRQLAAGEPAWASRELTWRAAELTARAERRAIADQIDALVDEVIAPPRPRGAAAPVDRDGVRACLRQFVELADDLRGTDPIRPQGIVLLRRLLRDGGSPLYSPGGTRALHRALVQARAALLD
jgi:hypothetical protein